MGEKAEELTVSEERLNTLITQTPAVIYSYRVGDGDPVTTYVSESVKNVLGFEPEYFVGSPEHFQENLHPEDAQELFEEEEKLLTDEDTDRITVEYRFKHKHGHYRWLHDEQQVSTNEDGQQEVFGAWWDISERKRAEQKLKRRNQQLDKFASVVSHDLRNPLNVAQGRINIARENRESDHLEIAAEAIDRSFDLIDDLLALARGGKDVQDTETIELADFLEDCWETVETPGAEIAIDVESTVEADRSRLRQLFENLFRNSIEHGGEDVTVEVGSLSDGFYVADTGPGIPPEKREKVFEEGYSESQDSTGFGLSIVKQIVNAHGWDVRISEGQEGGARFEITGVNAAVD